MGENAVCVLVLTLWVWATDAMLQRASSRHHERVACAIAEADSATSVLMTGSPLRGVERSDLHSTTHKPRSFGQDPTLHCPLEDFRDGLRRLALVAKGSPRDYQKTPTFWYFQDPSFSLCYPGMVSFKKSLIFLCFSRNSEIANTSAKMHFWSPEMIPRYSRGKTKFSLQMITIKDQLTQRPLSYSKISIYCILMRKKTCCCLKSLTPSSHYKSESARLLSVLNSTLC